MMLLDDVEWATWSDGAIAKACGVSDKTVAAHRPSISGISEDTPAPATRTVERNGTTYEQNTSNIGKAKPSVKLAPRDPDSVPIAQDIESEPAPIISDDDAPDMVQLADDLQKDLEASQKENDDLKARIKKLESMDAMPEVVRLEENYERLNGRLHGEMTAKSAAEKQAQFYSDLLAKIRKALNVTSNKDILAALVQK
jgi:flagellar motor protein MotB